ncbi:MAG: hypothetical protein IJT44_06065 [Clostridia bacterium]|nr:hypothetical protein [Clostridia bacterium]
MAFEKNDLLENFDVYPKVFVVGRETQIRVRSLGGKPLFQPDTEYKAILCAMDSSCPRLWPDVADFRERTLRADADGGFTFTHTFDKEQGYFLRFVDGDDKRIVQFPLYCVEEDLCGRYPLIGDLHIHTTCSDGSQIPEVVCANYRRHGYDFMVVSDHRRYYPSLRAIRFYTDVPTELTVVPGEEVHLPSVYGQRNPVHIVNFGGEFSINALVEGEATEEAGTDLSVRAIRKENVPDVMTVPQFSELMQKLADEAELPQGVSRIPYVMCKWIFDRIRDANGLGIYAHPNWIQDTFHVPEQFTDYVMQTMPFDAFEVLGGENYYEQNGFQTQRYYEERAKGRRIAVVGSTDSHSSLPSNRNAFICSTIVFSPENERTALIDSVKDFYSVAVDTISKEFRLVGESRFVRYACFLLKEYFPLHDELCYEEGRLMKQAAVGTAEEREEAVRMLEAMHGRMQRHREKYFAF